MPFALTSAEDTKPASAPCRPYVCLLEYEIAENKELLQWKFKSDKKAGCSGQCCVTQGQLGSYV